MIYEHDKTFTDGDGRLAPANAGGCGRKRASSVSPVPGDAGDERARCRGSGGRRGGSAGRPCGTR